MEISDWWASETSVSKTIQQTGHSARTIVDCYNYHRDVCTQWFLDNPVQVGVGKVVEINNQKFSRSKYNCGRCRLGHWGFGGIERGSNVLAVEVANRSAATLLPIIQQFVMPRHNSYISDESNKTVNHSINFVEPTTGAHTQTIESTWSQVKGMMRKREVMNTSEELFDTYLPEYLWRKKN